MYFYNKFRDMNYENKTYEELLREEERLDERYSEISDACAQEGLTFLEFREKVKPVKEKLYFISKYKRLKQTPTIEYGKEWKGDLFTLEEFKNEVEGGLFIDDDGYGYYATETTKSDIYVYPSDFTENIYRDDFTHIIWFNR